MPGASKYEAEEALKALCAGTDMEFVIIRPPLVYGAGVKANFKASPVYRLKIPLPFGCVNNKRSMVYVGNLASFIIKRIDAPKLQTKRF